jgi:ferredoxin
LEHVLGVVPVLYLGVAVMLVYTGTGFLVCRYDPFVSFFRLSGDAVMLAAGGALLLLGTVVARPYCRFLCPYGVLLGWAASLSWRRVTVTPDECVQCRLCEDACPFNAIRRPSARRAIGPRRALLKRTALYALLVPLLVAAGGFAGSRSSTFLSGVDRRVRLIAQLDRESRVPDTPMTLQSAAFRGSGTPEPVARADAARVRDRFRRGGWVLGSLVGLVVGCRLVSLAIGRDREDYEPDRAQCLACGRCFATCPREQTRRRGPRRTGEDG